MQKKLSEINLVKKGNEFGFKDTQSHAKCAYIKKCKGFVKAKALFYGLLRAFVGGWGKENGKNSLLSFCYKEAKFSQIPCDFRTWKQYER